MATTLFLFFPPDQREAALLAIRDLWRSPLFRSTSLSKKEGSLEYWSRELTGWEHRTRTGPQLDGSLKVTIEVRPDVREFSEAELTAIRSITAFNVCLETPERNQAL